MLDVSVPESINVPNKLKIMPEGPEVERHRRDLLVLEKKRLQKVAFTPLALKYRRYQEQQGKLGLLLKKNP
ncbi:MAG: hypothetical protein OXP71_03455 [Candidatus Poribacteria bacterium]|nr:hypothetical protein [Candidatus Poribacteria bacterium]